MLMKTRWKVLGIVHIPRENIKKKEFRRRRSYVIARNISVFLYQRTCDKLYTRCKPFTKACYYLKVLIIRSLTASGYAIGAFRLFDVLIVMRP